MRLRKIIYSSSLYDGKPAKKAVVFIHGYLQGPGIERPAFHCAPLIKEILKEAPGTSQVMMPEYHEFFPRLREDTTPLTLAGILAPIEEMISEEASKYEEITVVAYSFGAVILARLLSTRPKWAGTISSLALIAPTTSDSLLGTNGIKAALTERPTCIIWGTKDHVTKEPEKLRQWFPSAKLFPIHGGNHYFYLLPSPADYMIDNPTLISRLEQIERTVQVLRGCQILEDDAEDDVEDWLMKYFLTTIADDGPLDRGPEEDDFFIRELGSANQIVDLTQGYREKELAASFLYTELLDHEREEAFLSRIKFLSPSDQQKMIAIELRKERCLRKVRDLLVEGKIDEAKAYTRSFILGKNKNSTIFTRLCKALGRK